MSYHWHENVGVHWCTCDEEQEAPGAPTPAAPDVCGMRKPGGTTTCIDPAGHAGPDGRGKSHGDGSVIRWIYR